MWSKSVLEVRLLAIAIMQVLPFPGTFDQTGARAGSSRWPVGRATHQSSPRSCYLVVSIHQRDKRREKKNSHPLNLITKSGSPILIGLVKEIDGVFSGPERGRRTCSEDVGSPSPIWEISSQAKPNPGEG